MKFFIEQIAICPRNDLAAQQLLLDMGAVNWALDTVSARGQVYHREDTSNTAHLAFNYELGREDGKPIEFEILNYTAGANWMDNHPCSVSHLGMHCSLEELERWKIFFSERHIPIAQAVDTYRHTNPAITGKRRYTYVIFDTRSILGVDIKLIVRHEIGRVD